jgi:PAS domain S-box-containing protein
MNLVRYRLSGPLEVLLEEAAVQFAVKLVPISGVFSDEIVSIEPQCNIIFVEFPAAPDPTEVIRVQQWCLANPAHTLVAVFQSADRIDSNSELMNFVGDYTFADSSADQIRMRFQFALNTQKRQQTKLEQIRQSIAVDQLMRTDYGTVLGNLAEGVVYQGSNDEVLYANQAACEVLGLSYEQLMGKTSYDPSWAALKEDGQPYLPGEHPSAFTLRTGKALRDVFMSVSSGTGEMRQLTINTQPLFGLDKRTPTGVIASFRDKTGVLEAQKERDELRNQLLQSQKMEALGTLAGGIAHDFNNLLTPILALSQMLQVDANSGDFARPLAVIEANALSARDLINQILTFSRKKPDLISRVNLSELVTSVSTMVQEYAEITGPISFDVEDDLFIDGDSNQLAQLFMNIVTNAFKAVEETARKTIKVRVWRETEAPNLPIKVSIEDSGLGMSEALLTRIYEPFFTTSAPGKGTGLGLSVVHNVVKSHGGSVDCQSMEGEGTCFTLGFDESRLVDKAVETTGVAANTRKLKGSALILDDNSDSCDVLAELVEFFGMTAYKFTSPTAAVDSIRTKAMAVDLIISDFSMPEMNGFEFASAVRDLDSSIPIAIITGYGENLPDIAKEKCDMVLAKPIQLSELESALRKLIAPKRLPA